MSELTIEKIRTDLGVTKARLGEILGLTRQRIDQMQRNGINDNAVSQISEKIAFYKKNGFPMPSGRKIPYLGREITYFPVQVPIIRISNPKAYKKAFTEGDKDLQDTLILFRFRPMKLSTGTL